MTLLSRLAAHLLRLPPPVNAKVVRQRDIAVPMRDGTVLLADRWSIAGAGPVVLVRTPYGRGGPFALIYRLFAERGLQVVVQSCRGTGGSGGQLDPMRQEAADGLDTLEWVRSQSWCVGKLYTYGSSYVGFTQWAIAQEAGRRIDGMVLHVTLSNFRNETLAFGGFTQEGSLGWTRLMKTLQSGSPLAMLRGRPAPAEEAVLHAHLPLGELDGKAVGAAVPWWQDWVGHDDPRDPWWSAVDHSAKVADVPVPMAMIGGWKDIFLPWQIEDFCAAQRAGREAWLTVGPWSHAAREGFGESIRQALALFGGAEPFAGRGRVRLFLQGAEEWRDYSSWPPPGARERSLHLHPGGDLRETAPAVEAAPTAYLYDPADPTPSLHGPRLSGTAALPDMSPLERRADTVSFTGGVLDRPLDVIGPVQAILHVRADREHFDLFAILCDVDEQGRPLHVSDGYLRLRPDADGVREILLTLWPTAYRFKAGHRLRLIVASGAHPRYARNLGTGEPLATATSMVPARIEIFHDARHRSGLRLSVEET